MKVLLSAQATPLGRPRSPKRSTGQYLPGLAPATEVRKRAAELRQQHLAKLKRLADGQRAASSGSSEPKLGEHLACHSWGHYSPHATAVPTKQKPPTSGNIPE